MRLKNLPATLIMTLLTSLTFGDVSKNFEEIGTLRSVESKEIKASNLSTGFECLDRKIFDPEKTYDKLAKTGIKWARCQTGCNRCETKKGVYDFQWLDDVVNNLIKRGIQPWFNVGFVNPIYMDSCRMPRQSDTFHSTTAKKQKRLGKIIWSRSQNISKGGSSIPKFGTNQIFQTSGNPKAQMQKTTRT